MTATARHPITPADLESKMRELKGEVDEASTTAVSYLAVAGAVAVVAIVGVAYLLGRRKGRKGSTVVEVRRY
jgi:hypothetical protein